MSKKRIIEPQKKVIREINDFPKPICLEFCKNENPAKGFEAEIIETLQSFSSKEKFEALTPHPLKKSNDLKHYFSKAKSIGKEEVFSLDVGKRKSKYRLFYCIDDSGVCKILSLSTEESHK